MRKFVLTTILLTLSWPALACPTGPHTSTIEYAELCVSASNCVRVAYADLSEKGIKKQEAKLSQIFQSFVEERLALTDPDLADDPDRFEDPNTLSSFWSDSSGDRDVALVNKTHLTARSAVVTAVWSDGQQRFNLIVSCQ